ncbi:MAG: hypothetical protein AAFO91_19450, partial [Bacteroidota bacterium]
QRHGIQKRPITAKNPQANSICERMHQTVGNTLRVLSTMNPPEGLAHANQLVDTAIANAVFASRAASHSTLEATPGSLAFNRDMILDIPMQADFELLREKRQQLIDQRLIEANRKRFSFDYQIGQQVMKLVYKPSKLQHRAEGPYPIVAVHQNGTVTIQLTPTTIERLSVRRVRPYKADHNL